MSGPSRRRDELLGFWPGVQLAVGLGAVTGTVTATVLLGWVAVSRSGGVSLAAEGDALLAMVGWWGVLWLGLSAGLVAALWLGLRVWAAAYPAAHRLEAARERRVAVQAANALLEDARGERRAPRG